MVDDVTWRVHVSPSPAVGVAFPNDYVMEKSIGHAWTIVIGVLTILLQGLSAATVTDPPTPGALVSAAGQERTARGDRLTVTYTVSDQSGTSLPSACAKKEPLAGVYMNTLPGSFDACVTDSNFNADMTTRMIGIMNETVDNLTTLIAALPGGRKNFFGVDGRINCTGNRRNLPHSSLVTTTCRLKRLTDAPRLMNFTHSPLLAKFVTTVVNAFCGGIQRQLERRENVSLEVDQVQATLEQIDCPAFMRFVDNFNSYTAMKHAMDLTWTVPGATIPSITSRQALCQFFFPQASLCQNDGSLLDRSDGLCFELLFRQLVLGPVARKEDFYPWFIALSSLCPPIDNKYWQAQPSRVTTSPSCQAHSNGNFSCPYPFYPATKHRQRRWFHDELETLMRRTLMNFTTINYRVFFNVSPVPGDDPSKVTFAYAPTACYHQHYLCGSACESPREGSRRGKIVRKIILAETFCGVCMAFVMLCAIFANGRIMLAYPNRLVAYVSGALVFNELSGLVTISDPDWQCEGECLKDDSAILDDSMCKWTFALIYSSSVLLFLLWAMVCLAWWQVVVKLCHLVRFKAFFPYLTSESLRYAEVAGIVIAISLSLSAAIAGLLHGNIEADSLFKQCFFSHFEGRWAVDVPLTVVGIFSIGPLLHGALHLRKITKFHRSLFIYRASSSSISSKQSDEKSAVKPQVSDGKIENRVENGSAKGQCSLERPGQKVSKADRNLWRLSQNLMIYLIALLIVFLFRIVLMVYDWTSTEGSSLYMNMLYVKCHIVKESLPSVDCEQYNSRSPSNSFMAIIILRFFFTILAKAVVYSWAFRFQHWKQSWLLQWLSRRCCPTSLAFRGPSDSFRSSTTRRTYGASLASPHKTATIHLSEQGRTESGTFVVARETCMAASH